jgi:hypothetical protein
LLTASLALFAAVSAAFAFADSTAELAADLAASFTELAVLTALSKDDTLDEALVNLEVTFAS